MEYEVELFLAREKENESTWNFKLNKVLNRFHTAKH